jgi:hypothetical protein
MERFFAVQSKKVGATVGDEGVFVLADDLPSGRRVRDVTYVSGRSVGRVARCVRDGDKGCVKALVDQKLHVGLAMSRGWRVVRTGSRFAQGRAAGRPRRGKARK